MFPLPADQAQAWPGQAHAHPGAASPPCARPALSMPARCPTACPHAACPHFLPVRSVPPPLIFFRCDTAASTCAPMFQDLEKAGLFTTCTKTIKELTPACVTKLTIEMDALRELGLKSRHGMSVDHMLWQRAVDSNHTKIRSWMKLQQATKKHLP